MAVVRLEDLLQRPTTSSSRAFKGFFPPPSSPSGRSSSLPPPVFIDSHSTAGAGTPSTCSSLSQFSLVLETGAALDEVTTGAGTEEPAARADISCDPARDEGRQRRKLVEDYDSDSSGLSEPEEMDEENEERWEHATRVEAAPAPLDDRSLKRKASAPSAKMPTTKRRAGARQPWRISTPASLDDADSSDGELSPRVRPVDSAIDEQDDSSSYRRCPVRAAARPRRRTSSSFSSPPDGSPSPEAVHVPLFPYAHEIERAGGPVPLPHSRRAKMEAANKLKERSNRAPNRKPILRARKRALDDEQQAPTAEPEPILTSFPTPRPPSSISSNEGRSIQLEPATLEETLRSALIPPQACARLSFPLPTPPTNLIPESDLFSSSPLATSDPPPSSSPSVLTTNYLPEPRRSARTPTLSLKPSTPAPEVPQPTKRNARTPGSGGKGTEFGKKQTAAATAKEKTMIKGKGREVMNGAHAFEGPSSEDAAHRSLTYQPTVDLPPVYTPLAFSHFASSSAQPTSHLAAADLQHTTQTDVPIIYKDHYLPPACLSPSFGTFPPRSSHPQYIYPHIDGLSSLSAPHYPPPPRHHSHFAELSPAFPSTCPTGPAHFSHPSSSSPTAPIQPPPTQCGLVKPTPKATKPKGLKPKVRKEFEIDKTGWGEPVPLAMNKEMPPIWCLGRQELCEALPYYRAYQGGHYDKDERCLGYLLDGFPSPMDRCEDGGRVIISHGGGCSDPSPETPSYQLISNQSRDNTRVRSLINCFEKQVPVALIVGKNYHFFPHLVEMGVRYAVLGYYLVTAYWAEGEPFEAEAKPGGPQFFVRFKFRFEWLPSQGTPWFYDVIGAELPKEFATDRMSLTSLSQSQDVAVGDATPRKFAAERSEVPLIDKTFCDACGNTFSSVFEEPISCYHDSCPNFFQLHGKMVNPRYLHFLSSFLRARNDPSWPTSIPQSLVPQNLQHLRDSVVPYSREAWRAFHCSDCGRLSSRSEWDRLTCATEGCGAVELMQSPIFLAKGLGERKQAKLDGVVGTPIVLEGFEGVTYQLGEGARVHHLWPRDRGQADVLFVGYQAKEAATLFKRNPLTTHRVQGQMLCSQFSFNSGVIYNHVVKVQTIPLDVSPIAVQRSCEYLTNISRRLVAVPADAKFNEILSVAYMEGGKMNFHDDGETGLGPVVSTLSLGASATMSFRRKTPKSKTGGKRVSKVVCRLELQHGDVTIMEGHEVQKVFEHMVEPNGLRFAATARYIGDGNTCPGGNAVVPPFLIGDRYDTLPSLPTLPLIPTRTGP